MSLYLGLNSCHSSKGWPVSFYRYSLLLVGHARRWRQNVPPTLRHPLPQRQGAHPGYLRANSSSHGLRFYYCSPCDLINLILQWQIALIPHELSYDVVSNFPLLKLLHLTRLLYAIMYVGAGADGRKSICVT